MTGGAHVVDGVGCPAGDGDHFARRARRVPPRRLAARRPSLEHVASRTRAKRCGAARAARIRELGCHLVSGAGLAVQVKLGRCALGWRVSTEHNETSDPLFEVPCRSRHR